MRPPVHQFTLRDIMEIHNAAMFLASSLLIGFGTLFIAICIVLLNNLFHNYWKPIKLVAYHTVPHPKLDPELDSDTTVKKAK
jgi:vacuolar-type H+-ATPase subunit I/STV1